MYKCANNNFSFVVMVSIIKTFDKFMHTCLKGTYLIRIVSVLVLQIFRKKGMHIFKVLENQKSVTIEIYLLNVLFYCIPWDFLHI